VHSETKIRNKNFKPKQLKRLHVSDKYNIWHLLPVCLDRLADPVVLVDHSDRVDLVDQVDQVDLHQLDLVELDYRWDLWDRVLRDHRPDLWVLVDSCHSYHQFRVVLSCLVFHPGRVVRVVRLDLVDLVFLVGLVEREELAGLSDQLDQLDQVDLAGRVAVVGTLDNFVALDRVVSYHRVRFHPGDQLRQAYHLDQAHQACLWVLVDSWVGLESNCIQALDVFVS